MNIKFITLNIELHQLLAMSIIEISLKTIKIEELILLGYLMPPL
jgi:hypothetical protein